MGQARSDYTATMEIGWNDQFFNPKVLRHTGGRLFLLASVLHHVVGGPCHSWSRVVSVRANNDSEWRANVIEMLKKKKLEQNLTLFYVHNKVIFRFWILFSRDICDPGSQVADWILCPTRRCDASFCGFTRVLDTCGLYRWTSAATFDRPGAVIFAVFMSFWGEYTKAVSLVFICTLYFPCWYK